MTNGNQLRHEVIKALKPLMKIINMEGFTHDIKIRCREDWEIHYYKKKEEMV